MNTFMRFPNGKAKALTLSYDDGAYKDTKMIEILKPYGIKCTFNINSGIFSKEDIEGPFGRLSEKQVLELYKDTPHEVAVHSSTHPFLEQLPLPVAINDVLEDRKKLEKLFGRIIRGMAYPYGTYNDELIEGLKAIGIAYSRTVVSTRDFRIPTDWMRLTATCHHKDKELKNLTKRFVEQAPNHAPWLFYLWGHSFEFERDNNWEVLSDFAESVGNKEDIWYATNIEIYDYIEAYKNLVFNAEGTLIHNPTSTPLWFAKGERIIKVSPGETTKI